MSGAEKNGIFVFSGSGFLRAYSGTLYLLRGLQARGFNLNVAVADEPQFQGEYSALPFPCRCLPQGNLLANRLFRLRELARAWRNYRVMLVTETRFLHEVHLFRILKPRSFLVQYCQELSLSSEFPRMPFAELQARLAARANVVIDVEPDRARIRREQWQLRETPWILPNTLPLADIPRRSPPGALEELAGLPLPRKIPIVLHAGGVGKEKPLERLAEACRICGQSVFFLAFCNTTDGEITRLRSSIARWLPPDSFALCPSKPRQELLKVAWEASIGIIDYAYNTQATSNQLYCAPTKLYEFMAVGLPVLASNNPPLRRIVEGERIGMCATDDSTEALGVALKKLLESKEYRMRISVEAPKLFADQYCYERLGAPVVDQISEKIQKYLQPLSC